MCLCVLVGGDVSVRAGWWWCVCACWLVVMCLCVMVGGDVSVRAGWW